MHQWHASTSSLAYSYAPFKHKFVSKQTARWLAAKRGEGQFVSWYRMTIVREVLKMMHDENENERRDFLSRFWGFAGESSDEIRAQINLQSI
jgi:hypothetical protein